MSSAIRFLLNHITRTYPVIYAMGGADPAMGRACWRTRRARRAQCATALALAILAVLVAVGTLEAGWEPATTGAGAACDERAACEGQPATIYNMLSSEGSTRTTATSTRCDGAAESDTARVATTTCNGDNVNSLGDKLSQDDGPRREPRCTMASELGGLQSRTRRATPATTTTTGAGDAGGLAAAGADPGANGHEPTAKQMTICRLHFSRANCILAVPVLCSVLFCWRLANDTNRREPSSQWLLTHRLQTHRG